jgi:hypothetical protein
MRLVGTIAGRLALGILVGAALLLGAHAACAAPSTTHPRLWLTPADVTRLQTWTTSENPIWQNGLLAAATAGLATANAHWNWTTGVPDSGWQDTGSNSYEGDPTEAYAEMFAFMSLIDPVATIQALEPATAKLTEQHFWTTSPSQEFSIVAELEPSTDRLLIADSAMPANTRFLTVLQGTDQGVAAGAATRVVSTSGTAFEGAIVGSTVVLFPKTTAPVAGFSYGVPAAVTRHLITGLAPKAGYSVVMGTEAGMTTVSVTPGGTTLADAGGVLDLGFAPSAHPTQGGAWHGTALMQPLE